MKALSDAGFNTIASNVQGKLGAQHIPKGAGRRTLGPFWGSGLGVTDTVSRASAASGPTEVHTMHDTTVDDRGNVPSDEGFNTEAPNVQSKLGAQHISKGAGRETLGPFWGSGLGVTDTGSRASAASGPSEVHTMDETTVDKRSDAPRRDCHGGLDTWARIEWYGVVDVVDTVYPTHERAEVLVKNASKWGTAIPDTETPTVRVRSDDFRDRMRTTCGEELQGVEARRVFEKLESLCASDDRVVQVMKDIDGVNTIAVDLSQSHRSTDGKDPGWRRLRVENEHLRKRLAEVLERNVRLEAEIEVLRSERDAQGGDR